MAALSVHMAYRDLIINRVAFAVGADGHVGRAALEEIRASGSAFLAPASRFTAGFEPMSGRTLIAASVTVVRHCGLMAAGHVFGLGFVTRA